MFKKIALLIAAATMLTGCPSVQNQQAAHEDKAAAGPIDLVCIAKHINPSLQKEELLSAIAAGVQSTGLRTEIVDSHAVPGHCRLTLYYGITSENKKAKSFDFQAVLDGKALPKGSGAIDESGHLKLKTVAGFAAGYIRGLAGHKKASEAGKTPESDKITETKAAQ